MSSLSGLPPALAARAAAAATQSIAVRVLNLPENLQNNSQPVELTGIVKAQLPDGSLQVETKRGIINILLKDRGSLPVGQKLDIELPAGRAPQQAAISPAAEETAPKNSPQKEPLPPPSSPSPTVSFDRPAPIRSDELAQALAALPTMDEPLPSAPLQPGQILRLLPILTAPIAPESLTVLPVSEPLILFTNLLNIVSQDTEIPIQIRRDLLQIISRTDLSSLLNLSSEENPAAASHSIEALFQKAVQQLEMPENLKLQNVPLQNLPSSIFNAARPLDVQVLALQNTAPAMAFEAALLTPPIGLPVPVQIGNLVALPQPSIPALILPPASEPLASSTAQPLALPGSPVTPPSPSMPEPPASPVSLLGQVAGFTPEGRPIVSLALPGSPAPRLFVAQFVTNNIVEGSPLIVTPALIRPSPQIGQASFVPFALGANQPLPDWVKPDVWDSLQTLIGAASHLNPALAQSMTQMLPSAAHPQNMGALSLFFLSVMRSGDLESWIGGETLDILKQSGKIDVLRALTGEVALSNRLEAANLPNDWRAAMLPFWHQGQINKLPLFYKQWHDENAEDEDRARRAQKMRFLFNLKLSRMGDIQVDGFMQEKKLDMVLRTKSIISNAMQQALKKTYHGAMERSNLAGEITFQFKPEQWVNVEMAVS